MEQSLTVHFQVENGANAAELAPKVAERLSSLDGIEQAEASVESERFVAETVAVIAGIVVLTKATREGIEELTKLIASLRGMVNEVDGLRGAIIDFGGKKIPLDDPVKAAAELAQAAALS